MSAGSVSIRGLPAAPGRAEGPAFVVRDVEEPGLIPRGSVLVIRMIHPHLSPVFLRICAIVVEEGALLQHATTLAREFGIPAVVGATSAVQAFPDGARLAVDGDTGEVSIIGTGSNSVPR